MHSQEVRRSRRTDGAAADDHDQITDRAAAQPQHRGVDLGHHVFGADGHRHGDGFHPQVSAMAEPTTGSGVYASNGVSGRCRLNRCALSPLVVNATSARAPNTLATLAAARAMAPPGVRGASGS